VHAVAAHFAAAIIKGRKGAAADGKGDAKGDVIKSIAGAVVTTVAHIKRTLSRTGRGTPRAP